MYDSDMGTTLRQCNIVIITKLGTSPIRLCLDNRNVELFGINVTVHSIYTVSALGKWACSIWSLSRCHISNPVVSSLDQGRKRNVWLECLVGFFRNLTSTLTFGGRHGNLVMKNLSLSNRLTCSPDVGARGEQDFHITGELWIWFGRIAWRALP